MRPTTQEAQTGGVSPFDLAGQQDATFVAQDAQVIPTGRALGGVTVVTTTVEHDPFAQDIRDPRATTMLDTGHPGATVYAVDRGWWREYATEAVARRLSGFPDVMLDALRVEVVEAIGEAHRLHRRAVRAHGGSVERAAAEGYGPPQHDESIRHAQSVPPA